VTCFDMIVLLIVNCVRWPGLADRIRNASGTTAQ
jgi:hypothetical protein